MRLQIDVALDYEFPQPADVLLAVEAAQLPDQRLIEDLLTVDGATGPMTPVAGEDGIGRRTWLHTDGRLQASYRATVEVTRTLRPIDELPISPLGELPAEAIAYLWPSRYCQSDQFETFVDRRIGDLAGGARFLAMRDWIHN